MQIETKPKRIRHGQGKTTDENDSFYPHRLQMYQCPPIDNISLQEFEEFAIERLKVLKAVETLGLKMIKGSQEYNDALNMELRSLAKQGIMKGFNPRKVEKDETVAMADRKKDHISHFILRLAYCRTEDLKRWFIAQEVDVFRFRFVEEAKDANSIVKFLNLNKLDYKPIPEEEKNELGHLLHHSSPNTTRASTESFYKVPFIEALELVKSRRCYLSNGYAYVPQSDLVFIILNVFRTHLSHALAITARAVPNLAEDNRVIPMLNNMSKRYLGQDYNAKKPVAGQITADMLDGLAKKSYPPCMQHLHQNMRQNHHLRHFGRLQYGLFLKAIGLPLSEAMRFWRTEFIKMMDVDKFDKQYAYNIRYNYGKEGKRCDYTPYSCIKIVTTNPPAAGDFHGCPFRHMDGDLLKQKMQGLGVSSSVVVEMMDDLKGGHCQLACGRYFQVKHPNHERKEFSPMHPNEYFDESIRYHEGGGVQSSQSTSTPKIVKSQSRIVPSQTQTMVKEETGLSDCLLEEFDCPMEEMEEG